VRIGNAKGKTGKELQNNAQLQHVSGAMLKFYGFWLFITGKPQPAGQTGVISEPRASPYTFITEHWRKHVRLAFCRR
jgi:hypothetical protein